MTEQRKIIVYIATSAEGYIARSDGSVDWLNRPRPPGDYGIGEFFKSIDTILWGRTTYGPVSGKKGGGYGCGSKIHTSSLAQGSRRTERILVHLKEFLYAALPQRSAERLRLSANRKISCGYAAERALPPFDLGLASSTFWTSLAKSQSGRTAARSRTRH